MNGNGRCTRVQLLLLSQRSFRNLPDPDPSPFEVFQTQILLLEESFCEAVGQTLIGGDFNGEPPEWGEAQLGRREILVVEMVARNDLIVLNQGKILRSDEGRREAINDLTIAAPHLASRIGNSSVLEGTTLSDHQCIKFILPERSQTMDEGRGSKGRSPPRKQDDSAGKEYEYILKKPRLLMSLVGSDLLGRWKTFYLFPHVEPFQRQDRSFCVSEAKNSSLSKNWGELVGGLRQIRRQGSTGFEMRSSKR